MFSGMSVGNMVAEATTWAASWSDLILVLAGLAVAINLVDWVIRAFNGNPRHPGTIDQQNDALIRMYDRQSRTRRR